MDLLDKGLLVQLTNIINNDNNHDLNTIVNPTDIISNSERLIDQNPNNIISIDHQNNSFGNNNSVISFIKIVSIISTIKILLLPMVPTSTICLENN